MIKRSDITIRDKYIKELKAQLSISQVDLKAALVRERKLEAQLETQNKEHLRDRLNWIAMYEKKAQAIERVRGLAREALRQDKQVTHYQIIEALEEGE